MILIRSTAPQPSTTMRNMRALRLACLCGFCSSDTHFLLTSLAQGGIHEAGFAYWPGQIDPFSRSAEVFSSMDLFPTASALAGVPLPIDRVFDGRDGTDVLLGTNGGKSKHECLFFYGGAAGGAGPSAASCVVDGKRYKAHWATGPGLGGCTDCTKIKYPADKPLLFDIEVDPSEAYPMTGAQDVLTPIVAAYQHELATFTKEKLIAPPDGPHEGKNMYGVCCDRVQKGANATCDCDGPVQIE
jgi:arylsulfatase A